MTSPQHPAPLGPVAAFRRSAHRRLVEDPRRGRLLLQLAYLADAEARAIYDPYDWPQRSFTDLSPEQRAEYDEYCRSATACAREAARLGVVSGREAAFRDVFAAAKPLIEAAYARDDLARDVANAIKHGAVLHAGGCRVFRHGERRTELDQAIGLGIVILDGGEALTDDDATDLAAAQVFVGERGAGAVAARAALERWERERGEEAAA